MMPPQFVPLAEETGLILPIGSYVLERALEESADWRDPRPELTVSVNLSVRQLEDPRLVVDRWPRALAATGVDPERGVRRRQRGGGGAQPRRCVAGAARRCSALGVRIAIDDFGTGSSSLATLKRLPDRRDQDPRAASSPALGRDPRRRRRRSRAIVELGHALGVDVIAEGVETDAQLRRAARAAAATELRASCSAALRRRTRSEALLIAAGDAVHQTTVPSGAQREPRAPDRPDQRRSLRACGAAGSRSGRPRCPRRRRPRSPPAPARGVTIRPGSRSSSSSSAASRPVSSIDRPAARGACAPRGRAPGRRRTAAALRVACRAGQRPQARDQLLHRERLDQVVVGAGLEPGDAIGRPRRARSASGSASAVPWRAAGGRPPARRAPASPRRARSRPAPSARPRPARRRRRRRRVTSKPSAASVRSSIRRSGGSSSTTSTRSRSARVSHRRRRGAGTPGTRRPARARRTSRTPTPRGRSAPSRSASRSSPCQALNCVLSRYGCRPPSPGRIPISWNSSETISVPTTAAALLRVIVDSSRPIADDRGDRDQVDEQADVRRARAPWAPRRSSPTALCSELKPDWMLPAITATVPSQHDRGDRVGGRGQRLAGEDLPALERAREDRLQRAVVVLGGEDVAGDQRGDQREQPDRAEQQHHQRDRQPAARQVRREREVAAVAAAAAEVERRRRR